MSERVTVDITAPVSWSSRHFWHWRGRRAWGLVLAICPRFAAVGFEYFDQIGRGLAVMIGPLWIGIARIDLDRIVDEE